MIPLFSQSGLHDLEAHQKKLSLYAFDFDGTLAPIVDKPEEAQCPAAFASNLVQLQKTAKIAIISGRSIVDLKSKFTFSPDFLIGNHGLEGLSATDQLEQMARVCADWKIQWSEIQALAQEPGVRLEDKIYSLALHYRADTGALYGLGADESDKAMSLRHLLSSLKPAPRIIGGKWVLNLLPDASGNKGLALQNLIAQSQSEAAFYVGDDETDEDVFDLKDPRIFGVRIGKLERSNAGYYLDSQEQMGELLFRLANRS